MMPLPRHVWLSRVLVCLGLLAGLAADQRAFAWDNVVADDQIVQGSLAIGFNAVDNENFGFDTFRLKEDNLRIHFDDTSTQTGFPANDWRIIANDSGSGGANYFLIEDSTAARNPFRIDAGAPTDSLRVVTSSGNVGFGTDNPVLDLHVRNSNTPALRLEQDNSGGFTAQTWDIGANEANFFVRDVTGGSKLSFRIRPGAPTSSIDIASDGDVGIGKAGPAFPLHVVRADGVDARIAQFTHTKTNGASLMGIENDAIASLTNEAGVDFVLKSSTTSRVCSRLISGFSDITDGTRQGQLRFLAADNGAFVEAFRVKGSRVGIGQVNPTTLLQVVNATCNGTTWADASSRTLKHGITALSSEAAREAVMRLTPVTYAYNQNPSDPRVGFIAEDVPDLVAMPDRQTLASLDIVAVMAKVMQEQERRLSDQEATISALTARLQALESRSQD